jgi:hypothetical protein
MQFRARWAGPAVVKDSCAHQRQAQEDDRRGLALRLWVREGRWACEIDARTAVGQSKERSSIMVIRVRVPGFEPGISPPQGEVLTTILHTPGEAGYRSLYLSHAKRALYHLSYIPGYET